MSIFTHEHTVNWSFVIATIIICTIVRWKNLPTQLDREPFCPQVPRHDRPLCDHEQVPHLQCQLAGRDSDRLRGSQVRKSQEKAKKRFNFLQRGAVGFSLAAVLDDSMWYKVLLQIFFGKSIFRHYIVVVQGALPHHRPCHGLLHRLHPGVHHQVLGDLLFYVCILCVYIVQATSQFVLTFWWSRPIWKNHPILFTYIYMVYATCFIHYNQQVKFLNIKLEQDSSESPQK